jgi:hypothetical protein
MYVTRIWSVLQPELLPLFARMTAMIAVKIIEISDRMPNGFHTIARLYISLNKSRNFSIFSIISSLDASSCILLLIMSMYEFSFSINM